MLWLALGGQEFVICAVDGAETNRTFHVISRKQLAAMSLQTDLVDAYDYFQEVDQDNVAFFVFSYFPEYDVISV